MWKDGVRVCLIFLMACYLTTDLMISRRRGYKEREEEEEEEEEEMRAASVCRQQEDLPSPPSDHTHPDGGDWKARLEGPLDPQEPQLIDWIRERHLLPPSSLPYDLSLGENVDFTRLPYWQRVHQGILDLLQGKRGGFFLEAGALDGYYQSNTFFLERDYNWTGLLVEPNPVFYESLQTRHRRAWSSDLCLGTKPYPFKTEFWVYTGSDPRQGLIASSRSGLLQEFIRHNGEEGLRSGTVVRVQCVPPYSLLLALNVTHVDLFSLDIENAEVPILQAFPFDKIHVEVLVVEHWTTSGEGDIRDFIHLVESKGFAYYRRDNHDFFFVHRRPLWLRARAGDAGAVDNTEPYEALVLPVAV